MLNIYNIEPTNYVNGNRCRYVLWVQGCNLACAGCWNQPTWNFKDNILRSANEIFEEIKSLGSKIDGVTFSGGEPFLQADELSKLAQLIKENTTLDIQIFSGFSKDELLSNGQIELLKYTDILIAGRYDDTKENNNQTVHILKSDVDIWQFNNEDVQIEIDEDLDIKITGYPTDSLINEIKGDSNARV
jgi:anaerobic ribonucleoside-triphosphate reductase activating protein